MWAYWVSNREDPDSLRLARARNNLFLELPTCIGLFQLPDFPRWPAHVKKWPIPMPPVLILLAPSNHWVQTKPEAKEPLTNPDGLSVDSGSRKKNENFPSHFIIFKSKSKNGRLYQCPNVGKWANKVWYILQSHVTQPLQSCFWRNNNRNMFSI